MSVADGARVIRELIEGVRFTSPEISSSTKSSGRRTKSQEAPAVRRGRERFVERLLFELLSPIISKLRVGNYFSIRGGGRHAAVNCLMQELPAYRYVYKTDVKSYFASVDLFVLFEIFSS